MTDLEKSIANTPKVFEAGRETEWNKFWDISTANGTRTVFDRMCYGWETDVITANRPIAHVGLSYAFGETKIDEVNIDLLVKDPLRISGNALTGTFLRSTVRTVKKLGVCAKLSSYTHTFGECYNLENIILEGDVNANIDFQYSPLLSKASIESIVLALYAEATGKTLTLSETAVNNAFETAEGLADGSTSAEWIALRGTKTNWTISLA